MFNYHGEIRPIDNEGQLGKHVRGWINEQLAEGSSVESTVNNLLEYGCISGMVCHLITYVDTQNQNLLAWFGFEETARRIEAQVEEWKHEND